MFIDCEKRGFLIREVNDRKIDATIIYGTFVIIQRDNLLKTF